MIFDCFAKITARETCAWQAVRRLALVCGPASAALHRFYNPLPIKARSARLKTVGVET